MSASSSRGGISRIMSSQGGGSAALSLVQSSIRSSCMREGMCHNIETVTENKPVSFTSL